MATESRTWLGLASLWQAPGSAWISPRRKRFWVVALVLLYTLVGFWLAPWVIKGQLENQLSTLLDRPVRVAGVRINPYVLSLEVTGFEILKPDGEQVLAFERFFANFQASSLFRWALTFRELHLESPYIDLIRFHDGETNIGRVLAMLPAGEEQPPEEAGGVLRLIIEDLALTDGRVRVEDHVPATPFVVDVGPVALSVAGFSTLPEAEGNQTVSIATDDGVRLEWTGGLKINPLVLTGRVTGSGPYLPMLYRWSQDQVNFRVSEGEAEISFDYRVAIPDSGDVSVVIEDVDFGLSNVALVDADETRFLVLPRYRLTGGTFAWPEQTLGAQRFEIAGARLSTWRDVDGVLNLLRLVPDGEEPPSDAVDPGVAAKGSEGEPGSAAVTPFDDWEMHLGELAINDFGVEFVDHSVSDPTAVVIDDLDATISGLSNVAGDRFPFEVGANISSGGVIGFNGELMILPAASVTAQLSVEDLALSVIQPYLGDLMRVSVDDGALGLRAQMAFPPEAPASVNGDLNITSLSISDTDKSEPLVGWAELVVDQFAVDLGAPSLEISEVSVQAPFASLLIDADGSTNFQQLMIADEAEEETAASAGGDAAAEAGGSDAMPAISITKLSIVEGGMEFTDRALPIPFSASISKFGGEVSALSTVSGEPSTVNFEGQVADYGLAQIEGSLKPFGATEDTDVRVRFRNVALPDLDPYTVKFAGRRIADGRLDLDLHYRLEGGKIQGENTIVIDKLELGEKVDQPGAMDLPLGMAVALLTGPDGKIDLDIPVTGDVGDPSFSLSGAIAGAFGNIIASIVTSPFRLLAGLVGAGSEEFSELEFEPGEAELTPPEQEKIDKLAEALALRPNLSLTLAGTVDEAVDGHALAVARVDAQIEAELANSEGSDEMLSKRRRQALELMIATALPELDLGEVRDAQQRPADPAAPDGKQVLDEPAYLAELRDRLIDVELVTDADLDALASARSAEVQASLQSQGVDASRIVIEARAAASAKDGWVPMALEVGKL